MADISAEIAAFQDAVYGEEVRGAMIDLANKINTESSNAANTVSEYADQIDDLVYDTTDNIRVYLLENTAISIANPLVQYESNTYSSAKIECVQGDIFTIKGYGGDTQRLWMFINSSGNYITYAAPNTSEESFIEIVAPTNAAYLCVNNKNSLGEMHLYKNRLLKESVKINTNDINQNVVFQNQLIKAISGDEVIFNGIKTYNSYVAALWVTDLIPARVRNVSLQIQSVTGRIGTPLHLFRVVVYYTDATYKTFGYIDDFDKPLLCLSDPNKTIDYWGIDLYAAESRQDANFQTSWNILALNKGDSFVEGSQMPPLYNRIILNNQDVFALAGNLYGPTSKQYVAKTTSENWASGSWASLRNILVNNNKYIYIMTLERHGLGKDAFSINFYSSTSDTEPLSALNIAEKELYEGGPVFSQVRIPNGIAKVDVTFFGISNATAAGTPSVVGEEYYVNNCYVFLSNKLIDGLLLNNDWDTAIDALRAQQSDSLCFGIQTDTHFAFESSCYFGTLLKESTKYVGYDFIANLGDITRGYTGGTNFDSPDNMRTHAKVIMQRYTDGVRCPFLITIGNHESNILWANEHPGDNKFTLSELYAQYIRQTLNTSTKIECPRGKNYYYLDLDCARVICLFTNDAPNGGFTVSSDQVSWFTNIALDTNKPVLILCHVPLVNGWNPDNLNYSEDYANIISPLEAFKNNGGTVIACIYGHAHRQEAQKKNGIWHIICTKTESQPTTAEFFIVDLNTFNITTIGVGAAVSRSFIQD